MPVALCPRCQRANPDGAVFCYFDGIELRPGTGGAVAANRMAQEFVFPSGRRMRTFEEFAQGCQEEWIAARGLLKQGQFRTFFGNLGRADLAKAAQEAMGQADPDIALTTFLEALPAARAAAPKLDINPRRLLLGNLLAGETRQLQLTVFNQGQGTLQGTLTVAEGSDWLKIAGVPPEQTQIAISAPREQKITLTVDTKGVPAAQTYGAKLTVITNGGVVEVPLRMDLVAQPFGKTPFQSAKTPREMAERMRKHPKAAGPVLENGEIARWFASNGWNYPVAGTPAKGVAGVQQFFEAMGLSKPPKVKLSTAEMRLRCTYPESVRLQVMLQTPAKKWVYGQVTSDAPWLRVLTPQVGGPQQATINFELDSGQVSDGAAVQGKLQVVANGGQKLELRVLGEVQGVPARRRSAPAPTPAPAAAAPPPRIPSGPGVNLGALKPVVAMGLAFLLLRLLLVPFVDLGVRSAAVKASAKQLGAVLSPDHALAGAGGWLGLPWTAILLGNHGFLPDSVFALGPEKTFTIGAVVTKLTPKQQLTLVLPKGIEAKDPLTQEVGLLGMQAGEVEWKVRILEAKKQGTDEFPLRVEASNGPVRTKLLKITWAQDKVAGWSIGPAQPEASEVDLFLTWGKLREFRNFFASSFIRTLALWTWWIGALLGALLVWQRGGGTNDWVWGIVAGAVAGVAGSATLASGFLVLEMAPHALWRMSLGTSAGNFGLLLVWVLVAVVSWMVMGALVGFLALVFAPVRHYVVGPVQKGLAGLCRLCGLHGLAAGLADG